ncbi:MFS transporter [Allokutzneria sp. NRRL B-24872]|uniref:MFS transporter n=1 Tax=Allokutzneria sp. NRRL B-24872 TaxID=1137961 RepID=UPI000A38EE84|nr:MFS transporter [Allokutzneria sp. NRRL B-24872]
MITRPESYRWVVLAAGALGQGANASYFLGLPVLIPQLRDHFTLSLPQAGLLVGAVNLGTMLTLVLWGASADRFGERPIMTIGLVAAALCLAGAAATDDVLVAGLALLGAGAFGASANAASGRAVMIWFAADERGIAMGVRQCATPAGAALSALVLPLAAHSGGVPLAFLVLAGISMVAAIAVVIWVREPEGAVRAPKGGGAGEVLRSPRLWRLSLASACLVIPQFTTAALLVELFHEHRGVSLVVASTLLAVAQLLGAGGRLFNGAWSDRVASRLGPLRAVSVLIAASLLLVALLDWGNVAVPVLAVVAIAATALSLSWNGLAFTAAGEMAPEGRSGTALGFQNTANYLAAAIAPGIAGWLAAEVSWPVAFAVGGASALLSLVLLRKL